MNCHLGDFMEYAALRRALADAEKEGVKARSRQPPGRGRGLAGGAAVGDVIRIPAGRRAGFAVVVQPARGGKGDADRARRSSPRTGRSAG